MRYIVSVIALDHQCGLWAGTLLGSTMRFSRLRISIGNLGEYSSCLFYEIFYREDSNFWRNVDDDRSGRHTLMPLVMVTDIFPVAGERHERQRPFLLLGMVDESLQIKIENSSFCHQGLQYVGDTQVAVFG